jgi:DNA-binding XRE family transcriptional regulator
MQDCISQAVNNNLACQDEKVEQAWNMASKSDLMKLAGSLTRWREKAGISQPALAKRVGIAYTTLNNYENGRYWPSIQTYIDIRRALKVEEIVE